MPLEGDTPSRARCRVFEFSGNSSLPVTTEVQHFELGSDDENKRTSRRVMNCLSPNNSNEGFHISATSEIVREQRVRVQPPVNKRAFGEGNKAGDTRNSRTNKNSPGEFGGEHDV